MSLFPVPLSNHRCGPNCRNISITLIEVLEGEETAQTCEIAGYTSLDYASLEVSWLVSISSLQREPPDRNGRGKNGRHDYLAWSSPTRRTRSAKRGCPRRGSKKGCTFRNCTIIDCS